MAIKGRLSVLFSGGLQYFMLQPCRHKESGASAQRLNLGPYSFNLAIFLSSSQQHAKDAGDTQPGAFGRRASVSLVQQNQICGQFQCQRDSLGLTGIESRREQSRDLALPECLRFDPAVLESLLDLLN